MARPAVFFDRDDTLIVNVPYLGDPRQVTLLTGARDALFKLKAAGFALVVISNQSGVGRGLITPAQVEAVNARMIELLGGVTFDGIYNCFSTPEFDPDQCRKPSPKLVLQASKDLAIDLNRSYFIGDRTSDMLCAHNAGVKSILVLTGQHGDDEIAQAKTHANFVVPGLMEAAEIILNDTETHLRGLLRTDQ